MKTKIKNGVYLVVDPSMEQQQLFERLTAVLEQDIVAVQLWDNFPNEKVKHEIITTVCAMCNAAAVAVLINNDWQLLQHYPLDGVHFDELPATIAEIRKEINSDCIVGTTVNNNLAAVERAEVNGLDYISFCSIFPSSTSNSCELVAFDTIRKARAITAMPIFLAGGIRLDNINKLSGLDYNGVAIVSGIMKANDPAATIQQYNQLLKNRNETKYN